MIFWQDLGGYVSWTEPGSDLDRVMAYAVYLSLDAVGTGRLKIEEVPWGGVLWAFSPGNVI